MSNTDFIKTFRIDRILYHLIKGTLLERIQWELRQYRSRRRLVWWNAQAQNRIKFVAMLQQGVKIYLYFDSELSKYIFFNEFELKERHFLNTFLRPGDVFVDVGANIGLFTLIAAYLVGANGRVYSFEPTLEIYQRLNENIRANGFGNVHSYQWALSDTESEGSLFKSEDGYDAWNSFAKPIAGGTFTTETVHCKRWDDFAHDNNLMENIAMMKIDVEGWETWVLKGAFEMLSRKDAPVLLVEFTEDAARSAGSSCTQLYKSLEELGYKMFIYDDKYRTIAPEPLRDSYSHINLIAAKNPRFIHNRLRKKPL